MSQGDLEKSLRKSLEKLESATENVIKTRGYTKEAKPMKALGELIREQLVNENTRHSASKTR